MRIVCPRMASWILFAADGILLRLESQTLDHPSAVAFEREASKTSAAHSAETVLRIHVERSHESILEAGIVARPPGR
jgi:hypothetical protein